MKASRRQRRRLDDDRVLVVGLGEPRRDRTAGQESVEPVALDQDARRDRGGEQHGDGRLPCAGRPRDDQQRAHVLECSSPTHRSRSEYPTGSVSARGRNRPDRSHFGADDRRRPGSAAPDVVVLRDAGDDVVEMAARRTAPSRRTASGSIVRSWSTLAKLGGRCGPRRRCRPGPRRRGVVLRRERHPGEVIAGAADDHHRPVLALGRVVLVRHPASTRPRPDRDRRRCRASTRPARRRAPAGCASAPRPTLGTIVAVDDERRRPRARHAVRPRGHAAAGREESSVPTRRPSHGHPGDRERRPPDVRGQPRSVASRSSKVSRRTTSRARRRATNTTGGRVILL